MTPGEVERVMATAERIQHLRAERESLVGVAETLRVYADNVVAGNGAIVGSVSFNLRDAAPIHLTRRHDIKSLYGAAITLVVNRINDVDARLRNVPWPTKEE